MTNFSQILSICLTLVVLYLSYLSALDINSSLSPQGCRMSYMSPSYVLQRDFDEKWTSLSKRYSLWLYREVGWEDGKLPGGVPVIFIPGNAGASGQVRSIASSATRQYFSRPGVVAQEFDAGRKRGVKPLDFFALEFNEDLSAFHGPTLESQIRYTKNAISYILSLYPAHTQVIVLGHSMGGIVATALLPSPNVSAIITMSTPHTLPPARFDARIDEIYTRARRVLRSDPTPIVSLCGGATDMMIPSESCVLPQVEGNGERDGLYRRTVFTSALEGAWTGVGHREMVWCHQVRWRVARAALELGALHEQPSRTEVLDTWLRDGHTLPASTRVDNGPLLLENTHDYEVLPEATDLVLKNPHGGAKTYLLPYTSGNLVLYVSGGSVGGVSPYTSIPLQVSVYTCHRISQDTADAIVSCDPLKPTTLKLIPNPVPGKSFPVPREGADESEGVVLYESDIKDRSDKQDKWVGIKIEHADGRGWVVAGFVPPIALVNKIGTASLAMYGTQVMIPRDAGLLKTSIELPNLLSNVLTVYRISPILSEGEGTTECTDTLLPPLIMHTSHRDETHYFPLIPVATPAQSVLLHNHVSAPYVERLRRPAKGLDIVIFSSGRSGCGARLEGVTLELDWSATLGRWASRYPTTLVCWAVGVVALILFWAWHSNENNVNTPSVGESLSNFIGRLFPRLIWISFFVCFIPFPESMYLGNRGEPLLSFLAPLVLCLATGIVCLSWWCLSALIWPIRKFKELVLSSSWEAGQRRHVPRSTIASMLFICCLIFLFVPWQVAYLGCWVYQLFTCAVNPPTPTSATTAIPLLTRRQSGENEESTRINDIRPRTDSNRSAFANYHLNQHLLLFMTWLLPLTAPTLAVWVRTLITAGPTTPFDGDHNFLRVLPFLILVDFASRTTMEDLLPRQRIENRLSIKWVFVAVALVAAFMGARRVYVLYDAATIAMALVVIIRIGRRYWGPTQ